MDPKEPATTQVNEALKEFFEQVRFARAVELANSRRYLEAEGLLSPNGRESSEPKELDLLARIAAQQRQYGRARRLWESALKQSPDNADYKRAIERAEEAALFQVKMQKVAMFVVATVAVIVSFLVARNLFPKQPVSQPPSLAPKSQ